MNLNIFVFIAAVFFYLWLTVVINNFCYISVAVLCLFDSENQHLWENLVKRMSDRLKCQKDKKCQKIFCTYSNCQVMTYLNKHYFVEILYKCHTWEVDFPPNGFGQAFSFLKYFLSLKMSNKMDTVCGFYCFKRNVIKRYLTLPKMSKLNIHIDMYTCLQLNGPQYARFFNSDDAFDLLLSEYNWCRLLASFFVAIRWRRLWKCKKHPLMHVNKLLHDKPTLSLEKINNHC